MDADETEAFLVSAAEIEVSTEVCWVLAAEEDHHHQQTVCSGVADMMDCLDQGVVKVSWVMDQWMGGLEASWEMRQEKEEEEVWEVSWGRLEEDRAVSWDQHQT